MAILKIKDKDGNVYEILAIRGEKGERGERGVDAYAKAVEYGYEGEEEEFYLTMSRNGQAPDKTLTISGAYSDAKATGDAISALGDRVQVVSVDTQIAQGMADAALSMAESKAATETYIVTVTTDWTADGNFYYQDIEVPDIMETDNPIPGVVYGENNALNIVYDECFDAVLHITTYDGSVRVWAKEAIDTAFPILLKVVR